MGQVGMDPHDLYLLGQILRGDETILQELIRDHKDQVAIKADDQRDPEGNGRTVYLRLKTPFLTLQGEQIPVLSFKGVRPVLGDNGELMSHQGRGFVGNPIGVDGDGRSVSSRCKI